MSDTPHDAGQPMPKEEWDRHATRVTNEMKEFTKKFVTPVSRVIDHDHGEPWGTGNYIELNKSPALLINEHVAAVLQQNSLAHQFLGTDTVFRATRPFHAFGLPLDVAVSPIEERVWASEAHHSAAIPEEKWALAHVPVEGEILFSKA